jgi:hypothetical protein
MPIEWSLIQSAITAAAGLGGVWLGGRLTWKREEARDRERNNKEMSYLAILVVAHLDRFANACLYVALDDGTEEGLPAGTGGYCAPTVTPPTFDPLAFDVNWKALPAHLMYDILGMPYRIEQLHHHLQGTWEFDDPPDYGEFFWARQYGYADLGLEVSELARLLREHAALPVAPRVPGSWNRDDQLREQRAKIAGERDAYNARLTAEPVAMPTN